MTNAMKTMKKPKPVTAKALALQVEAFLYDIQDMFPNEPLFSDNDNEAYLSLVKLRKMMQQVWEQ